MAGEILAKVNGGNGYTNDTIDRNNAIGRTQSAMSVRVSDQRRSAIRAYEGVFMSGLLIGARHIAEQMGEMHAPCQTRFTLRRYSTGPLKTAG